MNCNMNILGNCNIVAAWAFYSLVSMKMPQKFPWEIYFLQRLLNTNLKLKRISEKKSPGSYVRLFV